MAPDCYVQKGKLGGIGMVSVGTRRQGRAGDQFLRPSPKQVAVPRWRPSPQQVSVPR